MSASRECRRIPGRPQHDMERNGVEPDVRSFTALIGAAALAGKLEAARRLFDAMAGGAGLNISWWSGGRVMWPCLCFG